MEYRQLNNLVSITQLYKSKPSFFPNKILDDVTALKSLVEELAKVKGSKTVTKITNNFLFAYDFKRLNQEFDLLKAVKTPNKDPEQKIVINIELKKVIKKRKQSKNNLKIINFTLIELV